MIKRLEDYCGEEILNHIEYKRVIVLMILKVITMALRKCLWSS